MTAMVRWQVSLPWSTSDAVETLADLRGVKRSVEARDIMSFGLSYLYFAVSRVREYLSGINRDASVSVRRIVHDLAGEVLDISDHIDKIIGHMVANGELIRVDDKAVRRTDKMPITRQRVTR